MITGMSKRIQVTLPDRLAEDLQRWADYDGRPLSNLAAYLLERAVTESKEAGAEWTIKNKPPTSGSSSGGKGRGKKGSEG